MTEEQPCLNFYYDDRYTIGLVYNKIIDETPKAVLALIKKEIEDDRIDPILCSLYNSRTKKMLVQNEILARQDVVKNDTLVVIPIHRFVGALSYLIDNELI